MNDVYNEIIVLVEEEMDHFQLECAGSELILLAIARLKDSMTSLIFKELSITTNQIREEIKKRYFLRGDHPYTDKFQDIMTLANNLMERYEYAYDEAYLFALLEVKHTVAQDILNSLEVDRRIIYEELEHAKELLEKDSKILVNLTKLAKEKKLNPFIGRNHLIDKVDRILCRKQKNNPMLIGEAGVGKTGLVEGVVEYYSKNNPSMTFYRLDLSFLIAGTRYRGDLEERLMDAIEDLKDPKSIVFIDEIHNIVASNSNEASMDVANLLKPILSRSEIKCIGATTLEEYYKFIAKDKALSRRFQNVFVEEVNDEECLEILEGIKEGYASFYQVEYTKEILSYMIRVSKLMTSRRLPDKAIDLLDEAGLITKRNNGFRVQEETVLQLIFEHIGLDVNRVRNNLRKPLHYEGLKKWIRDYLELKRPKNILNIVTEDKEKVMKDLKTIFEMNDEVVLELDLQFYLDSHYMSNLLGPPAGYVGYEEGGLLSEHIIKYPFSVLVFKNWNHGNRIVVDLIKRAFEQNEITDNKKRKISLTNTICIVLTKANHKQIGFLSSPSAPKGLEFADIFL